MHAQAGGGSRSGSPPGAEPGAREAAQGPSGEAADAGQRAGRGGLAVTAAKVYFILTGLVQQVALEQALGLEGYGAAAAPMQLLALGLGNLALLSRGRARKIEPKSGSNRPCPGHGQ